MHRNAFNNQSCCYQEDEFPISQVLQLKGSISVLHSYNNLNQQSLFPYHKLAQERKLTKMASTRHLVI